MVFPETSSKNWGRPGNLERVAESLNLKGLKVKKGVVQDATFITSDPGHKKVDEPRGPEAKTRRNKEGTWTKKGGKITLWL